MPGRFLRVDPSRTARAGGAPIEPRSALSSPINPRSPAHATRSTCTLACNDARCRANRSPRARALIFRLRPQSTRSDRKQSGQNRFPRRRQNRRARASRSVANRIRATAEMAATACTGMLRGNSLFCCRPRGSGGASHVSAERDAPSGANRRGVRSHAGTVAPAGMTASAIGISPLIESKAIEPIAGAAATASSSRHHKVATRARSSLSVGRISSTDHDHI